MPGTVCFIFSIVLSTDNYWFFVRGPSLLMLISEENSEFQKIMSFMNKDYAGLGLFELFLTNNVWQEYADTFLDPEQIDDTIAPLYMPAAGNAD